ncbi:hydroxyacylglutathione hydrolase [Pseudoalteromonas sp. T1lg65]|uniref:hydroxyacylglutathione hydrolase n=1 Tax=Pseudoalteromonas sp. T1lg65 TaxID=2077101 RepID=UPI003F7ABF2F
MVQVEAIKAFNDNYIWAISHADSNQVWVVDPGDEQPVLKFLENLGKRLAGILVTHYHWDHTDGIAPLKALFPDIPVFGPKDSPYEGITHPLTEGDSISLFNMEFHIITTPGHTLDHICYVHPTLAFTGDTLFNAGCGRMFEGTPSQMWHSLCKLTDLPDDCLVYCTHEYTLANLKFAYAVEPNNPTLLEYIEIAAEQRASNIITLPTSIGIQKQINPFLRVSEKNILVHVPAKYQPVTDSAGATFGALRKWKDNF